MLHPRAEAIGRWLQLDKHLDRPFAGVAVIQLAIPGGREAIVSALEATRAANCMEDGAHARQTVIDLCGTADIPLDTAYRELVGMGA